MFANLRNRRNLRIDSAWLQLAARPHFLELLNAKLLHLLRIESDIKNVLPFELRGLADEKRSDFSSAEIPNLAAPFRKLYEELKKKYPLTDK